MKTSTYPNFIPANVNDLSPGEWALARRPSAIKPYALIMITDRPGDGEDESACLVLTIRDGTAGYFSSVNFQSPVALLRGDIRIPIPMSGDEPGFAAEYTPGLLYVTLYNESVYLVAQRGQSSGPFVVDLQGVGTVDRLPRAAGLQRIEQIDYRAPDDSEWCEIARIDTPLDN